MKCINLLDYKGYDSTKTTYIYTNKKNHLSHRFLVARYQKFIIKNTSKGIFIATRTCTIKKDMKNKKYVGLETCTRTRLEPVRCHLMAVCHRRVVHCSLVYKS
jgi:hypothetical protein